MKNGPRWAGGDCELQVLIRWGLERDGTGRVFGALWGDYCLERVALHAWRSVGRRRCYGRGFPKESLFYRVGGTRLDLELDAIRARS